MIPLKLKNTKLMKLYFLFIINVFFIPILISGQVVNDSIVSKLKMELDKTGVSQVILFKDIIVDNENSTIKLQFGFSSDDAIKNSGRWKKLKLKFKKEKKLDLRKYLFFLGINYFKITNPKNVILEIRQSYENDDCPFIQYYYDKTNKRFTGDELEKICMAEYRDIIALDDVKFYKEESVAKAPGDSKEEFYKLLINRFRKIYTSGGIEGNSKDARFKSKYRQGDDELKFEVKDLQKEVLRDAGENMVYSILEFLYGKKFIPFEYLKYNIRLVPKGNDQIDLKVEITGRYGSGYYQTREWSRMNDMDEGFPVYLSEYIEKVTEEIIRTLTKDENYGR